MAIHEGRTIEFKHPTEIITQPQTTFRLQVTNCGGIIDSDG
jgi:hypothetical protein